MTKQRYASWQGTIAYFERGKHDSGRELFQLRRSAHSLSLQAICSFDQQSLVRSCQLELSDNKSEAFVRVEQDRHWLGSGHYRIESERAQATIWRPGMGAWREENGDGLSPIFGTHSLINDGWIAALDGTAAQSEGRKLVNLATCSHQADGGGAPALLLSNAWLEPLGEKTVKSRAGSFDCRGWRVGYGDHPPLDVWVTDEEGIMVEMTMPAAAARYDLIALNRLAD